MHDPAWIRALLGVHIAAGATAFVMAPLALATAKGGRAHRRWGKIYFWAMAVVAVTALVLAIYRPVIFLALVAVFSFYASFAAYRVLFHKDLPRGGRAAVVDWGAAGITFLACLALAFLGAFRPTIIHQLGIPAVVFGGIGMWLSGKSMWLFTHPPKEKMFWWFEHLGGMMASYIAAWTAFTVTTINQFVHGGWMMWLLPTVIGSPAIALTTVYYKRKFAPKPKQALGSAL
jgi:uncharacterized membrane protein